MDAGEGMSARRDLSGFHAPAKVVAPVVTQSSKAPKLAAVKPSRTAERLSRHSEHDTLAATAKKRITLSLPTAIADKLKTIADADGRYYLEIILSAFLEHAAELTANGPDASSPFKSHHPRRRRRPAGRVQVALLIHPDDLALIDGAADEVLFDRSSYIAELIERV